MSVDVAEWREPRSIAGRVSLGSSGGVDVEQVLTSLCVLYWYFPHAWFFGVSGSWVRRAGSQDVPNFLVRRRCRITDVAVEMSTLTGLLSICVGNVEPARLSAQVLFHSLS